MKRELRNIVIEAAIVVVAGLGFALAANEFSPRGLDLSRNYFPTGTNSVAAVPKPAPVTNNPAETNQPSEADEVTERLRDKGLQEAKRSQAESFFHSPGVHDGRVVFVDARDEDHYQDGHIPGAYQLNPYHPEKELPDVLSVCRNAEKVVVYCTGGECEDADTVALLLRDGGVSNTNIFVYGGGYTEWEASHLPLESGARNSGTPAKPQ